VKVFPPVLGGTGSLVEQPWTHLMQPLAWSDFTERYTVFFDHRGSLDAPEHIPTGSVRAEDFDAVQRDDGSESPPIRILVASARRGDA
jgi:hypothetical protein